MQTVNPAPRPVLVALLNELLNAETFDTIADVSAALKARAARLRIPYDAPAIAEALQVVRYARPIVRDTRPRPLSPDRLVSEDPIVPRDTARRIVVELWRRHDEARRKWQGCD